VTLLVLLSTIVFLAAVVAGGVVVFLRARELFRQLGSFGRELEMTLERVSGSADEVARKAATAGEGTNRLTSRLERLRRSREELSVLTAAVSDVRAAVGRVTGVVPRK
jgi:uncharacterized membrane protein